MGYGSVLCGTFWFCEAGQVSVWQARLVKVSWGMVSFGVFRQGKARSDEACYGVAWLGSAGKARYGLASIGEVGKGQVWQALAGKVRSAGRVMERLGTASQGTEQCQ